MASRQRELEEDLAFVEREIADQRETVQNCQLDLMKAEREMSRLKDEKHVIEQRLARVREEG